MKALSTYITEKLKISEYNKNSIYSYRPKDRKELKSLMEQLIKERGPEGDFNDIDTSLITDMSWLFNGNKTFNGDISRWNTSNVIYMTFMFNDAESFNQPIDDWDTSKVTDMNHMFHYATKFNQDISRWNVKKVSEHYNTFYHCPIKEQYKPKFKQI